MFAPRGCDGLSKSTKTMVMSRPRREKLLQSIHEQHEWRRLQGFVATLADFERKSVAACDLVEAPHPSIPALAFTKRRRKTSLRVTAEQAGRLVAGRRQFGLIRHRWTCQRP